MRDEALQRAVDVVGGVAKLAAAIGVSGPAVSQWQRAPATRVIQIEQATGAAVTREELRPDIYPPAPTKEAAA